jgi:chemotaxis protein CheD
MIEVIRVGMADLKVACHPSILTTLGLGSCVGITLYDSKKKLLVWLILCYQVQR